MLESLIIDEINHACKNTTTEVVWNFTMDKMEREIEPHLKRFSNKKNKKKF